MKCWTLIYLGARGLGRDAVKSALMHSDDQEHLKRCWGDTIRRALSEVPENQRRKVAYYIREGVREAKFLATLGRLN